MEEIKVDQKIDLRGVKCPLHYVQTKSKLEKMGGGEVLEVLLDDGEPIVVVPRSAKEDGYKILGITQIENYFRILLKKKA